MAHLSILPRQWDSPYRCTSCRDAPKLLSPLHDSFPPTLLWDCCVRGGLCSFKENGLRLFQSSFSVLLFLTNISSLYLICQLILHRSIGGSTVLLDKRQVSLWSFISWLLWSLLWSLHRLHYWSHSKPDCRCMKCTINRWARDGESQWEALGERRAEPSVCCNPTLRSRPRLPPHLLSYLRKSQLHEAFSDHPPKERPPLSLLMYPFTHHLLFSSMPSVSW